MSFDDRLRLDIQYIRRASLAFDAWLVMRTVGAILRRSGA
jgi:lipopolysaccharide/colanic/teichoic acid biosynthesis glycosyltransferase